MDIGRQKAMITEIVKSQYRKKGVNKVRPNVTSDAEGFTVLALNSETPYQFIGSELDKFVEEIRKHAESIGFRLKKIRDFSDFTILTFSFSEKG